MTDDPSQTSSDFQAKALLDRAFNQALHLHYHWYGLPDWSALLAELRAGIEYLADILPADVLEAARLNMPSLDGSSVNKEVDAKEAYRTWAATYDAPGNPLIAVEEPHTLVLAGSFEGKALADIGCGTGRYSRYAIARGASLAHGVDMSAEMLAVAREHARSTPNMTFAQGSVDAIPLPSGCYDLVICALALEHVPDVAGAIAEMARLLKSGGSMIVSDFHPTLIMVGTRSGIRNYVHRVQDYFQAMTACGLRVTDLREPTPHDLPPDYKTRMAPFVRTYGHIPFALILRTEKP